MTRKTVWVGVTPKSEKKVISDKKQQRRASSKVARQSRKRNRN